MYLEQAEVRNFRGIRELKVDFEEDSTVLIGENSWGKSSLLRALWMALGCGEKLCEFAREDLYIPIPLLDEVASSKTAVLPSSSHDATMRGRPIIDLYGEYRQRRQRYMQDALEAIDELAPNNDYYRRELDFCKADTFREKADKLELDLVFAEGTSNSDLLALKQLRKFWTYGNDGVYRIHWRITAADRNGRFETVHELLSRGGATDEEQKRGILTLIRLNPVLRIRDQRMGAASPTDTMRNDNTANGIFDAITDTFTRHIAIPASEMKLQLENIDELSRRYLGNYSAPKLLTTKSKGRNTDVLGRPISIETLGSLRETMAKPGINKVKVLTMLLAGVVLSSKGDRELSDKASPIIIFEDIEARFHPSLLLSFWSIIDSVSVQKIVTTNSGDLLSAIPLHALRRLYRAFYDTCSYKPNMKELSQDDQRRIAFHLRLNRPMSFFARTWLLVEGETEIWVMSQVAAIMGIGLQCEGIRLVEFAQCGLAPIIKLARQLGIAFYVLTDGDEAGEKYCNTVRNFVPSKQVKAHLTKLPALDTEHFLYDNGYAGVYQRCAGIKGALRAGTTESKVIDLAIRKHTKPGLAIEVIEEMRRRGERGIPELLKDMIGKITALSRGDFL